MAQQLPNHRFFARGSVLAPAAMVSRCSRFLGGFVSPAWLKFAISERWVVEIVPRFVFPTVAAH
jgi:hypothetical protein